MASDTSGSEYYEHSVQSEEEYDDEELVSDRLKVQEASRTRSKKLPARYREAFQSKEDLAVEMKDSKLLYMCTCNFTRIKLWICKV